MDLYLAKLLSQPRAVASKFQEFLATPQRNRLWIKWYMAFCTCLNYSRLAQHPLIKVHPLYQASLTQFLGQLSTLETVSDRPYAFPPAITTLLYQAASQVEKFLETHDRRVTGDLFQVIDNLEELYLQGEEVLQLIQQVVNAVFYINHLPELPLRILLKATGTSLRNAALRLS